MKRPFGVTIIMSMFLFTAFVAFEQVFKPNQKPLALALWVGILVVGLGMGVALYQMKRWSRWAAIVVSAQSLVSIPHSIVHGNMLPVAAGCHVLLLVWAIWYLFRPHVKSAFQVSERRVQTTC